MRSANVLVMLIIGGLCGTALAATPPAKGANPLANAITELTKEYQTAAKKGEGLREHCDYFAKDKPEGITADLVLSTLEKPVTPDVRADSYVKWQLLSALESKFTPEQKARVLKIYKAAPKPADHPGLNHTNLDRALNRVGIMKKEAEAEINKEISDHVTQYRFQIEPILSYRDELFSRLPNDFDVFVAGLQDVYDRVIHGAPANGFWTTISAGMRSWALTTKDTAQVRQLAGAVEKLQAVVTDDRNKPYSRVGWQETTNYMGLKWYPEQTISDTKSMEELAAWLKEQAANPGGGLGFKLDEPKKK